MYRALEAREREIINERQLDSGAGYVPGSEVTGMFQTVQGGGTPGAPIAAQQQPQQPQSAGTQRRPPQFEQSGFQQRVPPTGSVVSGQPNVPQKSDKTRKVMIGIIIVACLILLFLVAVIFTILVH